MKISIKSLVIIGIAMAIVSGWLIFHKPGFLSHDSDKDSNKDMVAEASRRNIKNELMLTGEVAPAFQIPVVAEVGGKVLAIKVEAGQSVKKGDVLLVVDDSDLQIQKESAKSEVYGAELEKEKTQGNFDRADKLYKAKLISKEVHDNLNADYEIACNALKKAKSALDSVDDKLSKTKIVSPADGIILDVLVNPGQVIVAAASVNSGTPLMTFADLSNLVINAQVNQMDIDKITIGKKMKVIVNQAGGKQLSAVVEHIAPLAKVVNNLKGFAVQTSVEDPDKILKPGITVRMTVPVADAHNAVSVPIAAIFHDNNDRIVYVKKGDITTKRKVTVGVTDLSYAEITSGLKEGEEILLVDPKNIGS